MAQKTQKVYKTTALLKKLGHFIKAKHINSTRSGEGVRNQIEIEFENGFVFQSYDSIIGIFYKGRYYFSRLHDYKTTTPKYCHVWCGLTTKERQRGLENGTYGLLDATEIKKY